MSTNLYALDTNMNMQPVYYAIHMQLNNMIAFISRVEVEAAIVMYAAGRNTRNSYIGNLISNLEATYGPSALIDAASLMGFCTLDKAN